MSLLIELSAHVFSAHSKLQFRFGHKPLKLLSRLSPKWGCSTKRVKASFFHQNCPCLLRTPAPRPSPHLGRRIYDGTDHVRCPKIPPLSPTPPYPPPPPSPAPSLAVIARRSWKYPPEITEHEDVRQAWAGGSWWIGLICLP